MNTYGPVIPEWEEALRSATFDALKGAREPQWSALYAAVRAAYSDEALETAWRLGGAAAFAALIAEVIEPSARGTAPVWVAP